MIPYWALFILVAFPCLLSRQLQPSQARLVWVGVGILLTLMLGFRHEVGGDWFNYERQFELVAGLSFTESVTMTKDPGYYPLGWVVARLGGSIYWLNLVCAGLLVAGTMLLASAQPRRWVALLAAVPYLLIVVGMGYTRQSAAIGCAMIGLALLGKGSVRSFVGWILIGAAFHKSAVLLLPIAAMAATSNKGWNFLLVGVCSVLGYWTFLYDSSETLISSYVYSDYAYASQGAGIRVAMNVAPAILLFLFRRRLFDEPRERKLWSIFAVGAVVCAFILPISPTASDRIALYFIPLQLVVFGRLVGLGHTSFGRTTLLLSVVGYYAAVQFVWLNFASHADAWLPYGFAGLRVLS